MDEEQPNRQELKLWETSQTTGKLAGALSNLQGDLTPVFKDAQGQKNTYASLEAILDKIQPLLKANRLSLTQAPVNAEPSNVCIITRLEHESGEYYQSILRMPLPSIVSKEGKETMNAAHKVGGAITYGRRYALTAVLGIAQTDDSGDGLEDTEKAPPRPVKQWESKKKQESGSQTTLVDEEIGPTLSMELLGLLRDAKWELDDIKAYFRSKYGEHLVPDNFTMLKKSMYNRMASAAHKRIADNKKAEAAAAKEAK